MRHIILLISNDEDKYTMKPFDIPYGGMLVVHDMAQANSIDIKVYDSEQPSDNSELESEIVVMGEKDEIPE